MKNFGFRISDFPDLYSKPDEEFPISDSRFVFEALSS